MKTSQVDQLKMYYFNRFFRSLLSARNMSEYKNLASLERDSLNKFLDSFDSVLCDCDGVIMKRNTPIAGVKETLQMLKKRGKSVRIVTNNSMSGLKGFQKLLNKSGYNIDTTDIINPTLAIISYLKKAGINKEVYLVGPKEQQQDFEEAGFKISAVDTSDVTNCLDGDDKVGAVVIDFDFKTDYLKLLKAVNNAMNPETLFIAAATDKRIPIEKKRFVFGPGYFQDIIQDLIGREPMVFGKPSLKLNDYIQETYNYQNPERVLFVGDALIQDMRFASQCGYQKLLVLTGTTNSDDLLNCTNKEQLPDFYLESFGELHKLVEK